MRALLLVALFAVMADLAVGHSYLSCVNFDRGSNTCKGFASYFLNLLERGGGNPGQLIQHNSPNESLCKKPRDGSPQFTAKYPQAKLSAGQTITVTWGDFNHGGIDGKGPQGEKTLMIYNAGTNMNPTDTLFRSSKPIATLTYAKCTQKQQAKDGQGRSVGGDRTFNCNGTFRLPGDMRKGVNNLVWVWNLNRPKGVKYEYSNCAAVIIN